MAITEWLLSRHPIIASTGFQGIVGHTGGGSIDNECFRNDVGLVPQDPFVLAASARENLDICAARAPRRSKRGARRACARDRIIVLNHGRITEAGAHDELMRIEGGLYQRLYLLQQLAL